MNVGEYGVAFAFSTGYNMSAFTGLAIVFTRPDLTTFTVQSPDVTAPAVSITTNKGVFAANTYAQYFFKQGDVSQAGSWSARVIYDQTTATPSLHLISDVGTFTVDP